MAASTSNSNRLVSSSVFIGDSPNQPFNCNFPKRQFGSQKRSFQQQWFHRWKWLHYEVQTDTVFCFTCIEAAQKKQLLSSSADTSFIQTGFKNWKDAVKKFDAHQTSKCHRDAVFVTTEVPKIGDIGDKLSKQYATERELNRKCFLAILQNIQFLGKQGLPLLGNDCESSNFTQLLKLRQIDIPELKDWTEKKTNKYLHSDIQNEILKIMAQSIIRSVCGKISFGKEYFTVMCDETVDCSNKEQMVLCVRWVDEQLEAHEEFLGVYNLDNTDSQSIFLAIKDCLTRLNLPVNMLRGQCYDGAAALMGKKNGVAQKILTIEPRAVFIHCYGHALNLSCSDAMKNCKLMRDTLDITIEITKLIKFSPKREACFKRFKDLSPAGDATGIRLLCPTRWTVRATSFQSVLDNYEVLQETWNQCIQDTSDSEMKARIIGVQSQMNKFEFLFGLHLCRLIFSHCDNLNKTLQSTKMTAAEGKDVANLTVKTLQCIRNDQDFHLFWQRVDKFKDELDVEPPLLPRKRRVPRKLDIGISEGEHPTTCEEYYRKIYFEALDLMTNTIKSRFDQPGYSIYTAAESVLLKSLKSENYYDSLRAVLNAYSQDFVKEILEIQLVALTNLSKEKRIDETKDLCIHDVIKLFREFITAQRDFFSEVMKLLKLVLVLPATNAVSERSFSALRRIKSYLRATMRQQRLNHLMVLNVHKDKTEELDLEAVGNEFIRGSDHRMGIFGSF